MTIYRFGSQASLTQDFYPTQGVNETYGQYTCRESGIKFCFSQPDQFLRRMSSGSSGSSQLSFTEHFDYASVEPKYITGNTAPPRQSYYFQLRPDTASPVDCRSKECAPQPKIELPAGQVHGQEKGMTEKKSILRRLLNILARFFLPCFNIKNRTVE